ncbi:MAG: D-alanyl-D-alanine carboxypeptidase family protein, partial [Pseudomonadota bacterium]
MTNFKNFVAVGVGSLLLLFSVPAAAQIYSTKADFAVLVDVGSGMTLFEKDANARMAPASMAKMMTLAVVFDALKRGELALHDELPMSENAWRKGGGGSGGSTMFIDPKTETVSVENLVRGIAVQSGNDACIVVAEGMSGNEESFAIRMNELAKSIGMTNSNFTNSTGLPDAAQYSTARDLAILGRYLVEEFPDLYAIFAEPEFTWNNIRQFNRNPLLKAKLGGDGIKTGFTKESGFGIAGSARQGDRRLLLVVNGLKSRKERSEETRRMLTWGFRSFESRTVFDKGEVIGGARVFGGEKGRVEVVSERPVAVLLPKGEKGRLTAKVHYKGPLQAPVEAGQAVGNLVIKLDGREIQ